MIAELVSHIKRMSIATRLIFYFYLLLVVQMLIIGLFSTSWLSTYLQNTYIDYMQVSNNGILQQINYIRAYYEDQAEKILSNRTIQDTLVKNYSAKPDYQIVEDMLTVGSILYDPTDRVLMIIVQKNGIIYQPYSGRYPSTTIDRMTATKAYGKSLESDGGNLWIAANENMMSGKREPFLYVCKTLKSLEIRPRVLGQLILQIPIDSLGDIFGKSKLNNGEYYAIVDSDGYFIYHMGDMNRIGEKADADLLPILSESGSGYQTVERSGENNLVSYSLYPGKGWNIIHVLPMNVISENAGKVRNYIFVIMLSSLLVLLPLLVLLSRNLSRPIKRLKSSVEQFGKGDLAVREKTDRKDEIGHLQLSFNKMAEDISNLLSKITAESKQIRLLELNILEYQINPHFLYNSLDSINWMAKVSGNKDIEDLVCALAKFLRLGLSKGKELYRVNDELEHVRQYLLINEIRFKDCFKFEIQAEPDVLQCLTIKIILQPVVENAIKYGINKKSTHGYIKISVKREGSSVLFEVSDNGAGIPDAKLQAIRSLLADHTETDSDSENGFGLYNVNQRIWLHFGDGYGITIDSEVMAGTTVRLKIPLLA